MKRLLLATTLLVSTGIATACSQDSGQTVNTNDREQIEQIVREYILDNPEIIEEAIIELQRGQQEAELAAEAERIEQAKPIIDANYDLLVADGRDYSIGPEDAEVTVVEFFDYRCGPCRRSMGYVTALPERFDGKVRVVFKEFPILSPQSRVASLAAFAAGEQGKYLEMHQALMRDSSNFAQEDFDKIAASLDLDIDQWRSDMEDAEAKQHLTDNRNLADLIGANATPTFVIGNNLSSGLNPELIENQISELLAKAG